MYLLTFFFKRYIRAWRRWRFLLFFCYMLISIAIRESLLLDFPPSLIYTRYSYNSMIIFVIFCLDMLRLAHQQNRARFPRHVHPQLLASQSLLILTTALVLASLSLFITHIWQSLYLFLLLTTLALLISVVGSRWSTLTALVVVAWTVASFSTHLLPDTLSFLLPSLSLTHINTQSIIHLWLYTCVLFLLLWWLLLFHTISTTHRKNTWSPSLSHE